jgi:hypothetical protein
MPRHPVINRRNISSLVRKTLLVSEEALERVNDIGARLQVSQGSLVDSALRQLAEMPPEDITELLRSYGHLTAEEYAVVIGKAEKGRK